MVKTEQLQIETMGNCHVLDITERVAEVVAGSGVRAGVVTLFHVGSTAGLTTTEYEPGLVSHDLKAAFERISIDASPVMRYDKRRFISSKADCLGDIRWYERILVETVVCRGGAAGHGGRRMQP